MLRQTQKCAPGAGEASSKFNSISRAIKPRSSELCASTNQYIRVLYPFLQKSQADTDFFRDAEFFVMPKIFLWRVSLLYSHRNATLGSTRIARRAGIHSASTDARNTSKTAVIKVPGSAGLT